jgi:esterase/lipase
LDALTPIPYTKDVKFPTLVARVHKNESVEPRDMQTIYDGIGAQEKELFWIEGTTRRFDEYN